jgi:NDP-4-keto-2,6-dideoxyhexose 3-C-methyltransferase
VDPSYLYKGNYYYKSGVNKTMRDALKDVVQSAQRYVDLQGGDHVIDIGANDGTLLTYYPSNVHKIAYEPSDIETPGYITRIKDYFGSSLFFKFWQKTSKIITACAMFYDLDDPHTFLKDVANVLADDGVFIIQMNYLISMVRNLAFDNISHEHLCYYSIRDMKGLCEAAGLHIEDAELNNVNGGSIRLYIRKTSDLPIAQSDRLTQLRFNEDEFYRPGLDDRIADMRLAIGDTGNRIHEILKDSHVCALGAGTRGYVILQYWGLDKYVTDIIDRNPEKVGKTLGNYLIKDELSLDQFDKALVLPYFFKDEIIARPTRFHGKYVIPLPEVQTDTGPTP